MKKIILILGWILVATQGFAQRGTMSDSVYRKLYNIYGDVAYVDAIEMGYPSDFWLGKGFYNVVRDGVIGIANDKGVVVFEPNTRYSSVLPIANDQGINGFYVTTADNKSCILDSLGRRVTILVEGTIEQGYGITMLGARFDAADAYIVSKRKSNSNPNDAPEWMKLYSAEGKLLVDNAWSRLAAFGEGLCGVKEGDLWGYMDLHSGEMVIPAQYAEIGNFMNGQAKVMTTDNQVMIITNPLKNNGKVRVLSNVSAKEQRRSDIDDNIPAVSGMQENTFVVIIANQNYQSFAVPYALADGKTFKEYCQQTLGIPATNIFCHEDATLNIIQSAMARVHDLADVYEGDAKFIVYFSGQGMSDKNGRPYLMSTDATTGLIRTTGYALEKLYSDLGGLNTQSVIVILDAGFNNEMRDGKPLPDCVAVSSFHDVNPTNGKVVTLQAASAGEAALYDDRQLHGFFTYFLCQKLQKNKGTATIQALFEYAVNNVPQAAQSLTQKKQTPQMTYSPGINIKNIKL